MSWFKNVLGAALVMSAFSAGSAQAAVSVFVGPSGSCGANGCFAPPGVTSILSSYTYYDFNAGLPGVYSGTGSVVSIPNVSGVYAAPFGDDSKYLTVGGGQTMTLTPGGTHNVFGLYWGSVDNYNKIEFFLGNVLQDTFLGSDARLTGITANGGQLTPNSNKYVSFLNLPYTSVRLTSTANAFETDNHLVGQVPEPSTLALLAMALLSMFGLGLMQRRALA